MKSSNSSIKDAVMKKVVSESLKVAEQNINSACIWWINQPKPPKSLKKLRKF